MTRILHENEAGIILGTDTGNPSVVQGASLLDELDYLVAAGLSPYEALAAGTVNATEALGRLDELGTVSDGKRADLVLLKHNPLETVANVRDRHGVMVRGLWYSETELQRMTGEIVDSYSPTLMERIWPAILLVLGVILIRRRARHQ